MRLSWCSLAGSQLEVYLNGADLIKYHQLKIASVRRKTKIVLVEAPFVRKCTSSGSVSDFPKHTAVS